jgi:microcystin-dependent protein
MAFEFPSNPTSGQIYENYVYNADAGAWDIISFSDGIPAGIIMAWGASSAPANWLICDGSAVSRSVYASLFSAIGTTYGSGDGSTTFNLPDLRGRIPVGKNGGSFGTLGATGGTETVTLTESQMPSHTHIQDSHNHTQNAHGHAYYGAQTGQNLPFTNTGNVWTHFLNNYQYSVPAVGSTTATNQPTTATNQNTGGGQPHNNLQPYIVTNYIIKYSAANTPGDSELATRVGAIETTTVRSVELGGTGSSTLSSGGYLKGNGTSAITSQIGIPAGDITSGTVSSARLPSGTILQVVESFRTSSVTVSGQYTYADTGLSVTITPRSSSSRFRLTGNLIASCSGSGWVFMRFVRNSTVVGNGTIGSSINHNSVTYITDIGRIEPLNGSFIDSPNTTSSITYKIQFATFTGTAILNRRSADLLFGGYSNLIVEEIG